MNALRLSVCPTVILCYTLLAGCNKASHNPPPSPPGPGVTAATVVITNCIAAPDPLSVSSGDPVIFRRGDANTYLVTFLPTATPSGPTVPVTANPFRVGGTSISQIMRGPSNCTPTGCAYKYKLNYIVNGVTQQPPCADPVIHIKPQALQGDRQ